MGNRDITLKRYYRNIRSCLPSSHKLKTKILTEIQSNVDAYLLEDPSADIAAIEARFGAPEQIAAAYVDELGTPELLKNLHVRKRVFSITIGAVAAILIFWLGVVGWAAIKEYDHSSGSITHSNAVKDTP